MTSTQTPEEDRGQVLLEVQGVSKLYPGVQALDNVSVTIRRGEALAVCGANGAGKSTLAKLVSGVEPPSSGTILGNGGTTVITSQREAWDAGVMLLHQEPLIIEDFNILENLWLSNLRSGGQRTPRNSKAVLDASRAALQRVGLGDIDLNASARHLPPGQRQMLALARAMLVDHDLLILDETTASASEAYFRVVVEFVAEERAKGRTVMFVSHRLVEVFELCTRILVLRNGEVVGDVPTADSTPDDVTYMMIGDSLDVVSQPPAFPPDAAVRVQVEELTAGGAREIDFEVHAGEIVALYGLVGSGRSSVLKGIGGHVERRHGAVRLDGRASTPANPQQAVNQGIAYVSEDRREEGFVLDFNNEKNLSLCSLSRLSSGGFLNLPRERELSRKLITDYRIKGAPHAMTAQLSGGNQQKVVIAKWIAAEPQVYLFDEPTKGVDVGARATIYETLFELARGGAAIVVATSEAEEALIVAHRVIVMRDGRMADVFDSNSANTDDLARCALA